MKTITLLFLSLAISSLTFGFQKQDTPVEPITNIGQITSQIKLELAQSTIDNNIELRIKGWEEIQVFLNEDKRIMKENIEIIGKNGDLKKVLNDIVDKNILRMIESSNLEIQILKKFNTKNKELMLALEDITEEFDGYLADVDNDEIVQIIQDKRLEKLTTLCRGMESTCINMNKALNQTKPHRYENFYSFFYSKYFVWIDLLNEGIINYSTGNCGVYGNNSRIRFPLEVQELLNLETIETLNKTISKSGKKLQVECHKKWFGTEKYSYNPSKHLVEIILNVEHPLDPWQMIVLYPQGSLLNFLKRL